MNRLLLVLGLVVLAMVVAGGWETQTASPTGFGGPIVMAPVCSACIQCAGQSGTTNCSIPGSGCGCPSNMKYNCSCYASTSGCYAACSYFLCNGTFVDKTKYCSGGGCSECGL